MQLLFKNSRTFFAAALSFSLCHVAHAADLTHAPKHEVGQKIQTETTTKVEQTLSINGMDIDTKADTFAKTVDVVESVSDDEVVSVGKIEGFQVDLSLPGGQSVNFDKGNPDAEIPAGPFGEVVKFYKALSDARWKTTLDGDRMVKSIEYIDNSFQDIPDSFKKDAGPERIKAEANQGLARLPGKETKAGESWTLSESQNLGSGQVFNVTRKFTYVGPEEHDGKTLEHITYKTETVEFEIEATSTLPLTAKDSDLSVKSSDGHIWYDATANRIVETEEKFQVVGDMTLVANGQDLPTKLDLSMHVKSTVTVE